MMKHIAAILAICLFCGPSLTAEETINSDLNWRIRQEETENSQIMELVHQLTDVYGPRLTGSPNFSAVCNWAIGQLKQWGMQNEHAEKWDFGHPGWSCDKYTVRVLSPFQDTLHARVVAWTPSTKGVVRTKIVQITPPERPSPEGLTSYLDSIKDKVQGRIVLVGVPATMPILLKPPINGARIPNCALNSIRIIRRRPRPRSRQNNRQTGPNL
jgi:carboxypeptidase Q